MIGGAPNRPAASTSHPCRASSACRAAARHVTFATVAPVTKPHQLPAGSPSRSISQAIVTSSSAAATGDMTRIAAF